MGLFAAHYFCIDLLVLEEEEEEEEEKEEDFVDVICFNTNLE